MSRSCPGFLDRYGIWNNGFDCSSPRICCGTEIDRYCCIPASTLSSFASLSPSDDADPYTIHPSNNLLSSEKWFFLRMCTTGIFLAMLLLIFIMIYLCLTSIRHIKRQKKMSIVQVPLPSTSSFFIDPKRSLSNRISTISHTSSDVKSAYTDATALNLYPTSNSRNSTTSSSSSSSYYIYPNEYEYLCK